MSFRIEDLKDAFELYILKCEAEYNLDDKVEVHGENKTFAWLLDQLASSKHLLPEALCEYMELRPGMTYSEVVAAIRHKSQ